MLVLTFRFAQLSCITQKGAYILIWAPVTKTAAQEMPSNHLILVASGTMLRVPHNCLHFDVVQLPSHVWLCEAMDYSTPGVSVRHCLMEFAQIHVHWVGDANNLILGHTLLLLPPVFPNIRVFSNGRLFISGGQSIGASLSPSILPMNIQG